MGANMLSINALNHAGIMVNYQCSAACRHCLYSCSPTRRPGYVSEESAEKICRLLHKGRCRSVHIGGGEPFFDFEKLLMMIRKLKQSGIRLEYIETNACWIGRGSENKAAIKKLELLMAEGANCLCISVDPFHAEYVPYGAALELAALCEKTGINYFIWKQEFLNKLSRLDSKKTYSRTEMENISSQEYIYETARHYGIVYGGRAVNIEREFSALYPAENFCTDSSPCRNLLSTDHFHVDMDCYFIPPGCTGIRVPLSETLAGFPPGKYPVFEALYSGGVSALWALALQRGFSPDKSGYPSKCNFCFYLRHYLAGQDAQAYDFPELDKNHYEEALKYY